MTTYYFVNPTESLFVRGNLAFGDAGEHGAGVMPPPPSLFAGAFRSAILGRNAEALNRFLHQGHCGDPNLDAALGRFEATTGRQTESGDFRLTWASLAGRRAVGTSDEVEAILPLPADLLWLESGPHRLTPGVVSDLVSTGQALPMVATLRACKQEKPRSGCYLSQQGFAAHLSGLLPEPGQSIEVGAIHMRDPRLGIGLDSDARSIESGLIYTTEGFAFNPPGSPFAATGFLVGLLGCDGLLPDAGFLRLGGDGRSASYRRVDWHPPEASRATIAATGRFRLILHTPGLFTDGWLPTGVTREGSNFTLRTSDFTARLASAAVPRREVISGWNLMAWQPKDAERVAPAGSVYWFDRFTGSPDKLAEWVERGLWDENVDAARRAEGYNLAVLGNWD